MQDDKKEPLALEKKVKHDDETIFAEERLKKHEANPEESITLEELKEQVKKKYGF